MVRPRKYVDLPTNLHILKRTKGDYFTYRSPITGRSISLGYDRDRAVDYAKEANEQLTPDKARREAHKITVKHGSFDDRGLLDGNSIVRKSIRYDQVCGVYFLIHGDMIVYVGQSKNVLTRLFQHKNEAIKVFDSFYLLECRVSELDHLEALYIEKFKPIYNAAMPKVPQHATAWSGTLSDVLGMS